MPNLLRAAATCLAALWLLSATMHAAQAWPLRSVRMIVPAGPGTAIDLAARLYAERLAGRWQQPVIVENRAGGDGITGVAAFVALDDDHTVLFAHSAPVAVQGVINDRLPYDPRADLVPISIAADIAIALAVSTALPVVTLQELVAYARARPAQLNWTAGPGLPQFVLGAYLKEAGLDLVLVSYREVAPMLQDLGAARVHVVAHSLAALRPPLAARHVRLLLIANRARVAAASDVPTAVEAGAPALAMDGLCGFYGRRGLSSEVQQQIARDVAVVSVDPVLHDRLAAAGLAVRTSTPAEFAAALQAQRERMIAITSRAGSR